MHLDTFKITNNLLFVRRFFIEGLNVSNQAGVACYSFQLRSVRVWSQPVQDRYY